MTAHEKLTLAVAEILDTMSYQNGVSYGISKTLSIKHDTGEWTAGIDVLRKLIHDTKLEASR